MLTILADDLTGACDTGTLFAARESVPVTVWPQPPRRGRVRVVDTETRGLPARDAAERVAGAAAAARGTRVFKKIDSTLRGNVGEEVDAVMRAVGAPGALLTPAFPALGRVVLDRMLLIDGAPVSETPLARDPDFPRRDTANVVDLLRHRLDRALAWIPIDQVRAGARPLAARLRRLAGTVAIADAETDDDLDALVEAALALEPPPLLVGAAGLARALAARLGLLGAGVSVPSGRWLIVAGSRHPATRAQVEAARAAGMCVVTGADAESRDRSAAAARLAADARRLLDAESFDVVAVTGGETAAALYAALDAERIDLLGAPAPGLALGRLRRPPRRAAVTVLTKAGGFGAPDLFVSLWKDAA